MGWNQLLSIMQSNLRLAEQEENKNEDPTICPICTYVLVLRADGSKNCPMGHFRQVG